jgi:choline kinase
MKAILLSAGQGRRLLPLTRSVPKCLLAVQGARSILELQLRTLARAGVERVVVMTGFAADAIERELRGLGISRLEIRTRFNPQFATSDNLLTCWHAIPEMNEPFMLVNGDTLFAQAVAERILSATSAEACVAVDRKARYDADDMKVHLDPDGRLREIGKAIPPERCNGEAIGISLFRDGGGEAFADALRRRVREPGAERLWYLSAVQDLALRERVGSVSVRGSWWAEVDTQKDLLEARSHLDPRSHGSAAAGAFLADPA